MAFKGNPKDLMSMKTIKADSKYFQSMKADYSGFMENEEEIISIGLDRISERFENLFIRDPLSLKNLVTSIKEVGLANPIRIMKIEDKIDSLEKEKKIAKTDLAFEHAINEIKYLEDRKEKGFEYVVIAGHRRLDAFKVIALETLSKKVDYEKNINEQFENYKEEIYNNKKAFEEETVSHFNLSPEEQRIKDKYSKLYIPSIIEQKGMSAKDEDKMYKGTNISAREITQFEIITNIYKELQRDGIDKDFLKDNGTYNYSNMTNYINEKNSKNISVDMLRRVIKLNEVYSDDFLELIYESKLTVKDARKLQTKFVTLTAQEKKKIYNSIKDKSFDVDEWLKQNTKAKPKRVSASKKRFINYLYEIQKGEKTLEEVIKIMEEK